MLKLSLIDQVIGYANPLVDQLLVQIYFRPHRVAHHSPSSYSSFSPITSRLCLLSRGPITIEIVPAHAGFPVYGTFAVVSATPGAGAIRWLGLRWNFRAATRPGDRMVEYSGEALLVQLVSDHDGDRWP